MLYIHSLKDLTPKTADIESVPIIREIKSKIKKPFTEEEFKSKFSEFFPDDLGIEEIKKASKLIEPTIEEIKKLIDENNPSYEAINLYRTVSMLEEINQPLIENIKYSEEIKSLKDEIINEVTHIFNNISSAKSHEESIKLNEKVNSLFRTILRNADFAFNSSDMINEGKLARIKDLHESLSNGFLFHITVKEHLEKIDFNIIKNRIRHEELRPAENIARDIFEIKKGVQSAYDINMKMVNLLVIIYSYIKALLQ